MTASTILTYSLYFPCPRSSTQVHARLALYVRGKTHLGKTIIIIKYINLLADDLLHREGKVVNSKRWGEKKRRREKKKRNKEEIDGKRPRDN